MIFPWGMIGVFKPFPGGDFDKSFWLITFSIPCPVWPISSQSPGFTLFLSSWTAPIPSPSSFRLSEWNGRETGSYWCIGEGRLDPEASGPVSATSVRVVVDVGINVIYRTQVPALICIQSLAVTWHWSSRPPLTRPWANQMPDFYNSCFRSMCLKKEIPLLSLGTQWLSENHGIFTSENI